MSADGRPRRTARRSTGGVSLARDGQAPLPDGIVDAVTQPGAGRHRPARPAPAQLEAAGRVGRPLHLGVGEAVLAHLNTGAANLAPDVVDGALVDHETVTTRPAARFSRTSLSQNPLARSVSISNSNRLTISGVTSSTST